jgi:pilus assembly protein CpaB
VKKIKMLALIAAVATALLLYIFLNSLNQPAEITKRSVIVAASDIPANKAITAAMIKTVELPAEAVVSGAVTDKAEVIGKIAVSDIFTDEQLLKSKLVSAGGSGNKTLAFAIEPGMRAMTISVDETSGIANMIVPGNHVDIIAEFITSKIEGDGNVSKVSYTTMILQNIQVLAIDSVLSENGKSDKAAYKTLTLELTPRQAMELSEAQLEGQLRAILRSAIDSEESEQPSVRLSEIMTK